MITTSNDIRMIINILSEKKNSEKENNAKKAVEKKLSLQEDNIQKDIFNKLNEGSVLNIIRNETRKESVKSSFSESRVMKYDLCMINKYDENLNNSLSFISEFDLEEEGDKKNDSFDSLENDKSVEQIDIFEKSNKKDKNDKINTFDKDDNDEQDFNSKLEKEWADIKELLLNKKLKS